MIGRVSAIRIRIRIRRRRPHPSPPTTDSPPEPRRLSEVGDVVQLAIPVIQAAARVIPVVGTPLGAAVDGLLQIIQAIETTKQNKVALSDLVSRLGRLSDFLSDEPKPRNEAEARQRMALAQRLRDTSCELRKMQKRRAFTFAYKSTTQAIADCNTDIDRLLLEHVFYGSIKTQSRQIAVSLHGCATLIDAVGHEYPVDLRCCTSFQQLMDMLPVLIPPERSGASVQRRFIESREFDFCIDDGQRVTLLTRDSNAWRNIEAGTRIVMRVVFKRQAIPSATYECHLCGARNKLVSFDISSEWLTNGSLDCYKCKGRYQISYNRDRKTQGVNDDIDTETRHCIRNFCVMQTEPLLLWEWEKEEPDEKEKLLDDPWLWLPAITPSRPVTTAPLRHPHDGFTMSHSQFEKSASQGALLESGPIVQQLGTSSRHLLDDMSDDDRFEECNDELEEVESI